MTKEGKPWLSFGLKGGDMKARGHAQVLCNLIDFGMDVQEAGDAPRFCHLFATSARPSPPANRRDGGAVVPSNRASAPTFAAPWRPRDTAS